MTVDLGPLQQSLGTTGLLSDKAETAPFTHDLLALPTSAVLAVARPATTDQVAEVVRWCRRNRVAIVPQGGNSGLCGGAVPIGLERAIILSLGRMNRIRGLDERDNSMLLSVMP